jgi:type II secretory pathway pseudopilin PulG
MNKTDQDNNYKLSSRAPARLRQNGLTIFELLFSVSIISIVLMMGVPGFKAFSRKMEINNGVRTATSAISYARYLAIKDNRSVKLRFKENQFELQKKKKRSWATFQTFDPGEKIEVTMNASPVFSPNGYISPLCSILIKNQWHHYKITISIAGRIKVIEI